MPDQSFSQMVGRPQAATGAAAIAPPPFAELASGEDVPPPPLGRPPSLSERAFCGLVDIVAVGAFAVILVLVFWNTIARKIGQHGLDIQEISELGLVTIAFVGAAVGYVRDAHTRLTLVTRRLTPATQMLLRAGSEWLVLGTCATTAIIFIPTLKADWIVLAPSLQIPQTWLELPLAVGLAAIAVVALFRVTRMPWRAMLASFLFIAVATGAVLLLVGPLGVTLSLASSVTIAVVLFAALCLLGVPVAFVFLLSALVAMHLSDAAPLSSVPFAMLTGTQNFVLLAVPFFVLTGELLAHGGLSQPLTQLVRQLVGRLRGGVLHVLVVTMYLFSGVSGSKFADVTAVGSTARTMLDDEGVPRERGAAVLCASAAMGETIPPSIALVVMGSIANLSISRLFLAGLVPAALLAVLLMIAITLTSRRPERTHPTAPFGQRAKQFAWLALRSVPVMAVPVILIVGIVSGTGTPTEVSSFAAVYAIALALVVGATRLPQRRRALALVAPARPLDPPATVVRRDAWRIAVDSVSMSGMVLFIVATASGFSAMLSLARVPESIASIVVDLGGETWLFLAATIVTLIVMGVVLEGLAALLVFGPLLVPLAPEFGVDPLQYTLLVIICMGIGAFLPPIGVGAFVASAVMRTSVERIMKPMLPFVAVLILGVILLAAFPQLSLFVVEHVSTGGS